MTARGRRRPIPRAAEPEPAKTKSDRQARTPKMTYSVLFPRDTDTSEVIDFDAMQASAFGGGQSPVEKYATLFSETHKESESIFEEPDEEELPLYIEPTDEHGMRQEDRDVFEDRYERWQSIRIYAFIAFIVSAIAAAAFSATGNTLLMVVGYAGFLATGSAWLLAGKKIEDVKAQYHYMEKISVYPS